MMKEPRRKFIQKAAFSVFGSAALGNLKAQPSVQASAGIELCLAYFFGLQPHRIQLSRQMGVHGAVAPASTHLAAMPEAKPWDLSTLTAIKNRFEQQGLTWKVLEGTPPMDNVKLGLPGRDEEIEHFITLIRNLPKVGLNTICYNWMPVINWARTSTDRKGRGGALVTAFDHEQIKGEPLTAFGSFSPEQMWNNLFYFLDAVLPEAERHGVKLALHPDDPPIPEIRGISRIMTSGDAFKRMIERYPSPSNGLTFCQGTFATMGEDIPALIDYFGKRERIFFVHFRDVRGDKWNFEETFHDEGKTDMFRAMQAYFRVGFRGPLRPDHVPTVAGDSNEYPGYSSLGTLFAIGYIKGLIEAVTKTG